MAKARDEYELVADAKTTGLETGVDRIKKKFGELGESENKQKRHLLGLVSDLTSARSATDVLAASIMRLSETFKVGLAGGIGVGLGLMIKSGTDEITQKFDALGEAQKDIANQAATSDVSKPMEKLKAEAAAAGDQAKKLKAELDAILGKEGVFGMNRHSLRETFGAFASDMTGGRWENQYEGAIEGSKTGIRQAEERQATIQAEINRREKVGEQLGEIAVEESKGPDSASKRLGIQNQLLHIAKEELKVAKEFIVRDDEDIQKKTIALNLQEQRTAEADAEATLIRERYKIEEAANGIRLSAMTPMEKQYKLAKLTADAAKEEALAMASKNSDQAAFLALKEKEASAVAANIDEQTNKGKSGKEIRARIRDQEAATKESEDFRKKRKDDMGLIPTKRGMDGKVSEGFDPITGEKKAVIDGEVVNRNEDTERQRLWKEARKIAKKDAQGVNKELGPKPAEGEQGGPGGKGAKAEDPGKETVQELKGLRQDIKGMVAKR